MYERFKALPHTSAIRSHAAVVLLCSATPLGAAILQVYHPCILQTKKRYVGFMYENPAQKTPTFDAKGIETVRPMMHKYIYLLKIYH